MKAIILAAGYATRLYPLTLNTPKPLLKIGKKKLVEHILSKVETIDEIDVIYVVTNQKFSAHFERWLKNFKSKKKIKIINDGTQTNEDRLGAIGDIHFVVEKEKINDDILVVAGDNLFEFPMADFVYFFKEKNASIVGAYDMKAKEKLAKKYGVVETDESHKIIGFEEKPEFPKTSLAATACYLFTGNDVQEVKRCIQEKGRPDNSGDFMKYLAGKTSVYAYVFDEKWFDIGSFESLREAVEYYV
ncbi:MAG: nucleotidyltransferase family protein [Nanoarchaeota archaeon]